MKTNLLILPVFLAVFLGHALVPGAQAQNPFKKSQSDLEARIGENRLRLEERQLREGKAIPPWVLSRAAGIVIMHHVKVGVGFGAEVGNGVALIKNTAGEWGPPAFVSLSKGSWGAQIGANESTTFIVFMTLESLRLLKGGGADVGVGLEAIAGPHDAGGDVGNISLQKPILVYTDARGAYVGATLQAGALVGANKKNQTLYGADMDTILFSGRVRPTAAGKKLIDALTRYMQ